MPAMRRAWAAAALLLSAAASAVEVEGVNVPERTRIGADGPELVLNGAGVRVRLIFKVYVAALYLPAKMDNGETILRDDRPRRLFLHMLRDLSADQLVSSTNDALRETLTPEERLPLESRMQRFNAIFETLREVKEGGQIVIDYVPQLGTIVRVNGEEKERIPGTDFNQALLRMWIGERPRDPDLKKAMLGIGSK
jgi:long-chain acyl-CoA synthetase